MEEREIKKIVLESVSTSFVDFSSNPFHFMYENDMQSHLFNLLRRNLNNPEIPIDHNNSAVKSINLINTEYGEKRYERGRECKVSRVDIVCLNEKEAVKIITKNKNEPNLNFLWSLPILIGIEIKLITYQDLGKGFNICLNDRIKLAKFGDYLKNWLQLTYFQNEKTFEAFCKIVPPSSPIIKSGTSQKTSPEFDHIHLVSANKWHQI